MNKFVPALIDANVPTLDPSSPDAILSQYNLRIGSNYLSPSYITTTSVGPFGVPYWMQGIALQTCNNNYITVPTPFQNSIITHAANAIYTAGQFAIGQAPTSGIYTGVEDNC